MKIRSLTATATLALLLAASPIAGAAIGFLDTALAKGSNGNGGAGGNGNGNGGSHSDGKSAHGKSDTDPSDDTTNSSTVESTSKPLSLKAHHPDKRAEKSTTSTKSQSVKSSLGSLNSLKRDYHAYLNSKDPKMAAVSAYVKAYAEFEIQYGINAVPTDPALSDNALRSALEQLSNKTVTDQTLAEAKAILGVGTNVGKIAEVRDALEKKSMNSAPQGSAVTAD